MLLTGGFDKTLRIYQIDGKTNILYKSVFFSNFPIYCAAFINNGDRIMCSCEKRKNLYVYDLKSGEATNIPNIIGKVSNNWKFFEVSPDYKYIALCGEYGYIVLIDGTSFRWLNDFKINSTVYVIKFSPDGKYMYAGGYGGEIYIFDIEKKRCIKRFMDEGSHKVTAIALSTNGYCATGYIFYLLIDQYLVL